MKIKICHRDATGSFHYTWVYGAKVTEQDGDSLYVAGTLHTDTFQNEVGYWIKRIGDSWWLHHDSKSALQSVCMFFVNGRNVKIGDLPCDEDLKVVYTLKYDHIYDDTYYSRYRRYHYYQNGGM